MRKRPFTDRPRSNSAHTALPCTLVLSHSRTHKVFSPALPNVYLESACETDVDSTQGAHSTLADLGSQMQDAQWGAAWMELKLSKFLLAAEPKALCAWQAQPASSRATDYCSAMGDHSVPAVETWTEAVDTSLNKQSCQLLLANRGNQTRKPQPIPY